MPIFPDQAETANNRDALAGISAPLRKPEPQQQNANGEVFGAQPQNTVGTLDDSGWLQLTRQIKAAGEQYIGPLRTIWANNYRAIASQHLLGSKYNIERYRGRSQLHRPKTFTSLKKANAGAANALFATSDVVEVTASDPMNPQDVASADLHKHLLNLRLTSKSAKVGLPWFMLAVGAHDDTRCTGICVSKQYWDRQEKDTGETEDKPVLDEQGQPQFQAIMDEATGQPQMDMESMMPMMGQLHERVPKRKVMCDKPAVRLFPAELVIRDPGADWLDQSQSSSYIGLMHAMTIGDIKALAQDPQNKTKVYRFRQVSDAELLQARIGGGTTQGVGQAREGNKGQDRTQLTTGINDFERIWAIEWFVRYGGEEYVYWTAGSSVMLSDVSKTEDVYPEHGGARPIVIGLGNIQPHKIDPISMVQSTLPLQQEMDDLVNMRLDGVKESIRPLTFIKRGKNIDSRAIQSRSGDTAVYVTDKDDVTFDRPGNIGGESYMEMNNLNADFDDATGQFNGSSVSTNRSLNETVGGMKLLNQNANIVGDFDLRVFIDTWVEPVLAQLVALERYYEDDATIIRIAGEKAKLFEKHGIQEITSDIMERDLSVTVNAGIGNADPMVKLDKFIKVAAAAGNLLGPEFMMDRIKQDAVIDELFGAAGFREASQRFFHEGDQTDQRIVKLQQHIQTLNAAVEEKQAGLQNQVKLKQMDAATQMVLKFLDGIQQQRQAEQQDVSQARTLGIQHAQDNKKTDMLGKQKAEQISASQAAKAQQGKPTDGKKSAALPAKQPEPQEEAVEDKLGTFSEAFITMMLPALLSGQQQQQQMPQQQPQAQPQEVMPPQQPQAEGPDPMMMQLFQGLMASQQQVAQGLMMMAQAMNKQAAAQIMPKTVQKNPDGSMTLIPAASPQQQPAMTGEQVYG